MKIVFKQLFFTLCVAILVVIALCSMNTVMPYFNLSYIKAHQELLSHYIHERYSLAVILYIFIYALLIICMLSFTLFLTTVGGFLFTTIPGTLYSLIGGLLGSMLSFLLIRYFLYGWLSAHYHNQLERFSTKFKSHGVIYLLFLYFFPLTPYPFINILAALSNIPFLQFFWVSALGILPITILCSFAGKELATINSLREIISTPILIILTALSSLIIIPITVKYCMRLKKKNSQ